MRPPKTMARSVCLWFARLLLSVGACFDSVGTSERLSYADHVRWIVRGHTQIKCGGRLTCWSDFPLEGIH
jgi:hypothetical protein